MMPKADTIAAITKLNPSADPAFLSQFSNRELDDYLHRLSNLDGAAFVRPVVQQVEIAAVRTVASADPYARP